MEASVQAVLELLVQFTETVKMDQPYKARLQKYTKAQK